MSGQRPDRVCVIGSGWAYTSGISYYTCRLSTELANEFRVSVILMRRLIPRFLYPGKKRVGVRVNALDYPATMPVFDGVDWYWGLTILRAVRFLRRERPTVVVLQWWTGAVLHSQWLLARVARGLGARIVVEFHETQDSGEARFGAAQAYLNVVGSRVIAMAESFVVHSEFDRQAIVSRFDVGDRTVAVAPHGPYDNYLVPVREPGITRNQLLAGRDDPDDITLLLFFGTVRPYKGLEVLVSAFNSLDRDESAKLHLLIVGETWEGWSHPVTAARQGVNADRTTVVNRYVTDDEVSGYFAIADVAVLPYTRSSASGPLHIAMAHGLPTILSDVGGLREGAAGYDGVNWVNPQDEQELRNALVTAPGLRARRYRDPRSWSQTGFVFAGVIEGGQPTSSNASATAAAAAAET